MIVKVWGSYLQILPSFRQLPPPIPLYSKFALNVFLQIFCKKSLLLSQSYTWEGRFWCSADSFHCQHFYLFGGRISRVCVCPKNIYCSVTLYDSLPLIAIELTIWFEWMINKRTYSISFLIRPLPLGLRLSCLTNLWSRVRIKRYLIEVIFVTFASDPPQENEKKIKVFTYFGYDHVQVV